MEISLRKFITAMRKNGYEKNTKDYIVYGLNSTEIIAACAIGQAGLNLGIDPTVLDIAIAKAVPGSTTFIVHENDDTDATVPEIADAAEQWMLKHGIDLDTPIFI